MRPARRQSRSSSRNALTLMAGTLGSRITGFLRQSLITQLFKTEATDAFFVALRVPNLFRELLAEGSLTNSFIPSYKRLNQQEARRFSAALLGLLILVNGLLLLLTYAAAPWIVQLLLLGDGNVNPELTLSLVRIVFPFLLMVSLSAWAMGILNAEERFFVPAWAPVALNLTAIGVMLLFPNQAYALAWGFVLGGLIQFLIQLPPIIQHRYSGFIRRIWHPELLLVLTLMIPSVITTSGRQVLNLVTSNVLNLLPEGSNTAFMNAELFLSLALGLFSISPTLAFYSRLSAHAADEPEAFNPTLLAGLKFIGFLTVPAGLILMLLASSAVELTYNWFPLMGRSGADVQVLELTTQVLFPLGLAIFPIGLSNLLVRTFYIRKNIRTPIIVSLIFLSLQAVLYLILSQILGIAGLSWATVIFGWLQFISLMVIVSKTERLAWLEWLFHAARVWLAALSAGLVVYLTLGRLPEEVSWFHHLRYASLGTVLFALVYATMAALLKLPELMGLVQRLSRKGS